MRIAYTFEKTSEGYTLYLRPSSTARGELATVEGLEINYAQDLTCPVVITSKPNEVQAKVFSFLAKEVGDKVDDLKSLYQCLHENGARQVVWDEKLERFRNCTTMKGSGNQYSAVGIVVTADDVPTAQKRIANRVMGLMVEHPEKAPEYTEWFASGRPVGEGISGACPDWTPIIDVVGSQGPIKVKARKIRTPAR